MKGRLIQDNIIMIHELVKNYKRNGGPKSCAIKVDTMKEFDMVSWRYLMRLMKSMNFPDKYLK